MGAAFSACENVDSVLAQDAQLGVWLTDATPQADAEHKCSPVLTNADGSLEHGALPTTFKGCTTAWQIVAKSFEEFKTRDAVGARGLLKREMEPDEKGKLFEKLTFADAYTFLTYQALGQRVADFGSGLVAKIGLKPGDKVLIFAETQLDWIVTALACWRQGVVVVTAYATLGEEGVSTSSTQTEAAVCVCDAKLFKILAKAVPDCKGLKTVVPILAERCEDTTGDVLNEAAMKAALPNGVSVVPFAEVLAAGSKKPCDPTPAEAAAPAVIMYTSGTTGGSKGVILSHRNVVAMVSSNQTVLHYVNQEDVYISYLPLAHIMELETEVWLLGIGACMGYGSPHTLTDTGIKLKNPKPPAAPTQRGDAPLLRPTLMLFAPAVLDKVYAAINMKMDSSLKKWLLECGLHQGALNYAMGGQGMGVLYNAILGKKVQALVGGRVRMMATGSAPLSPAIQQFVQSVFNCPVRQGYGCTETTGGSVIGHIQDNTPSQVGPPTACTYIRLRDWEEGNYKNADLYDKTIGMRRGEVLIGGPSVCDGYLVDKANPDKEIEKKNKEDFVEVAGVRYFCTGDVGQVTDKGTLQIIDRKKDLFKGATGEYVALSKVEACLKLCPFVEMPMVYGKTGASGVVGLVMPQKPAVLNFAKDQGLAETDFAKLCKDSAVLAEVTKQCNEFCKKGGLLPFETPGAYALVCDTDGGPAWTPDNEMLTSTMKLKRPMIAKAHEKEIQDCYARAK